jgi:hypothetical protein
MNLRRFLVTLGMLLALAFVLGGCQKKEEAAKTEEPSTMQPAASTTSSDTTAAMPDTAHADH